MNAHIKSMTLLLCLLLIPPAAAQQTDQIGGIAEPGDTPTTFENPDLVARYLQTITANDLASHLYFFASDFFEGRETTARGQKMAAEYLAAQYRKMGVAPKGTVETDNPRSPKAYLQPFPLYESAFEKAELFVGSASAPAHVFGGDATDGSFMTMFGGAGESEGSIVFAGYGIGDDDLGYNDFTALAEAGIDYDGKWVMMLADEPMSDAETSLLPTEGGTLSTWTTGRFNKLRAFFGNEESTPAGILVVGDLSPHGGTVSEAAMAQATGAAGDIGNLSLDPPSGTSRSRFPTVLSVSADLASTLLRRDVAAVKASIDADLSPVVFESDTKLRTRVVNTTREVSSENVVAFIEGSDPVLKNEYVVISSHYDHVGMQPADEDGIFNGADDDGSGTVTVLEIAEAFAQAKADGYGPRRSIVFLNVSGEEKGLLGSAYYTDREPVVPLDRTVTNLNIDMIGRIDPTHPDENTDYVYIIGSNLVSQELHDINIRANQTFGSKVQLHERFNSKDDPNQFYRRSDHWNFGKNNIPFIFFFTGTHDDYHGVDDEPDKIEYERMAKIAHVIFATAWQVANQDTRPAVTGEGFN
ncbi:MAG: M28 family peptidase [Rhodothermales bacterium]